MGLDGFTVTRLKGFWAELSDICEHTLSDKDKDHLEARNYRPISLLSVIYKVASGAITRRLQHVIESVTGIQ